MQWNENQIARALVHQFLNRKCLIVLPRCGWTGYEADLLGVTPDRRLLDFEIKISRSDLKADAKKDKWWMTSTRDADGRWRRCTPRARPWPVKIWKHYYVMPADIWKPDLVEALPSPHSGVLLLSPGYRGAGVQVTSVRRSTACKEAYRLTEVEVLDLARHAGLRLWDALAKLDAPAKNPRVKVKP